MKINANRKIIAILMLAFMTAIAGSQPFVGDLIQSDENSHDCGLPDQFLQNNHSHPDCNHLSTCPYCDGAKKCAVCSGGGQDVNGACSICNGSGKCYFCNGTGSF